MLTFETHELEEGIRKTTNNAGDLVEAAVAIRSLDNVSNSTGYGVLLMQTGLEEVTKASFLFGEYVNSLRNGSISISNKVWKTWMGGPLSHKERLARLQYLYTLAEQESAIPVAPIMFPQGVDELLQNRNAALYVDFDDENRVFRTPSEMVNPSFLFANAGFARHVIKYTQYDQAIDFINDVILHDRDRTSWFIRSIEKETTRKYEDVLNQLEEYSELATINKENRKKPQVLFCARSRPDGHFGLLHGLVIGTKDETIFFLDENTNHFEIRLDRRVIHSRFLQTKETALGFRNDWEVIDSLSADRS